MSVSLSEPHLELGILLLTDCFVNHIHAPFFREKVLIN
jgi:hypothetical protein